MSRIGDRIGAILGERDGVAEFLGYGVYVADEVPPADAVGWMAEACREYATPNPKLVLDDGQLIFGCQCWWGQEAAVKKNIAGYEKQGYVIKMITMKEVAERLKAEEAEMDKKKEKCNEQTS
jgi:hypothetical protein